MIQVPYEVSKFLTLQALLTPEELELFLASLGAFELYDNVRIVTQMAPFPKDKFLLLYKSYYHSLMTGEKVPLGAFAMSADPEALKEVKVGEGRFLIKPHLPVIQLKEHAFLIGHDGVFVSNVHGNDLIRWGIELIFPQIFVDPTSKNYHHVMKEERFLNGELFRRAMKWIWYNTRPPFRRASFRLGLEAFEETKEMVDLSRNSLFVKVRGNL